MAGKARNQILTGVALGAVVLLAGAALGGFLIWRGFTMMNDALKLVTVPGEHSLEFTEPGTRYVFYEHRSVVDGRMYSTPAKFPNGLSCELADPMGEPVPLMSSTSINYSLGSREGTSLFRFDISEPGTHTLVCDYAEGTSGPEVALAVGENMVLGIVGRVFGALATCGVTALLLLIILIVTIVKATSARRDEPPQI